MIKLECELIDGCVFLTGHTVSCSVRLSSLSPEGATDNIAWVSAQVQCFCQVNSQLVKSSSKLEQSDPVSAGSTPATGGTSYRPERGERGRVMVSTATSILACDVCLCGGQQQVFKYQQKLPSNIPPSFRGKNICFTYKITIGVQRVGDAIKLLRAPVRILPVVAPLLHQTRDSGATTADETENISPVNPFLTECRSMLDCGEIERSKSLYFPSICLPNLGEKRSARVFNITNKSGRVVRLCLYRLAYRLGDEVIGYLDFSGGQVSCIEYSVRLETVENVNDLHRKSTDNRPHIQLFSKCHDVCVNVDWCSLSLRVPLHATPSFTHQLMSLKWRLHFEFVTQSSSSSSAPSLRQDHSCWDAPQQVHVETMTWNLDIDVHSCSPQLVQQQQQHNNTNLSLTV